MCFREKSSYVTVCVCVCGRSYGVFNVAIVREPQPYPLLPYPDLGPSSLLSFHGIHGVKALRSSVGVDQDSWGVFTGRT